MNLKLGLIILALSAMTACGSPKEEETQAPPEVDNRATQYADDLEEARTRAAKAAQSANTKNIAIDSAIKDLESGKNMR